MDVQAREKATGRIISDLRSEDFIVLEGAVPKRVTVFDFEAAPLDVVALVDTSGGTGRGTPPDLDDSLNLLAAELRPGDRLGVMSFASKVRLKTALTDDEDAASVAIRAALRDRFGQDRQARIYDALTAAAGLFPKKRTEVRRHAILLVTHNRNASPHQSPATAIAALLESDATLDVIVVPGVAYRGSPAVVAGFPGVSRRPIPISGGEVKKTTLPDLGSANFVVDATGGELIGYDTLTAASLTRAIRRLRSRYLLGFAAQAPEGRRHFREVTVKLTDEAQRSRPPIVLRARRGYYSD